MIAEQIHELIKVYLADKDLFLVDIKVTPGKITFWLINRQVLLLMNVYHSIVIYTRRWNRQVCLRNKEFGSRFTGMDQPFLKVLGPI